ncbi:uncharacterized protein LOC142813961 [Rhipicephalus microplus]|uniref:uncharacterized protein LOC142813961 n=1 Tax=Rhipicephalus microplus TaxID=6941 RepID=UPI003F6C2AF8
MTETSANVIHSDVERLRHCRSGTSLAHSSSSASAVPYANNLQKLSNLVGTIDSVDGDGGIICFGGDGTERAFFSRASLPKHLMKNFEKMSEIFSVGQKVCIDVQRNHDTMTEEPWQVTRVTTVQPRSSSSVFEDYTGPTRVIVHSSCPETSRKHAATSAEVSGVRAKSPISVQQHYPRMEENSKTAWANTVQRRSVVQPIHIWLPEELDTRTVNTTDPGLVDATLLCTAVSPETTAFQGATNACVVDTLAGQPMAFFNTPTTKPTVAPSLPNYSMAREHGGADAGSSDIDEEVLKFISAAIKDGLKDVKGMFKEELRQAFQKVQLNAD